MRQPIPIPNWSHPLNRNLVAWYYALHPTGAQWRDIAQYYHGTLSSNGAFIAWSPRVDGLRSRAVRQDDDTGGGRGFTALPDALYSALNGVVAGTLVMWCKLRNATPGAAGLTGIAHLQTSASTSHYPYTDGSIYCAIFRSARVDGITPSAAVTRTDWNQVAVTTDGTAWKMFQNAIEISSVAAEATIAMPSSGIRLGASNPAGAAYLDGWVDDVRFYAGRALSQSELRQLYDLSRQGSPGLLATQRRVSVKKPAAAAPYRGPLFRPAA